MKIRSKALWKYLHDMGVLTQGEEAIANAKREYRRLYKREHKRKRRKKEVRPSFSPQEYEALTVRARLYNLRPTTYARQVILEILGFHELIPNRNKLLQVLQKISLALIASSNPDRIPEVSPLLTEAETELLRHLGYDTKDIATA